MKSVSNVLIVGAAGEEVLLGSPLLRGYSTGRYGSLWAASAGDICPSLYSEYGCSVCTSSLCGSV